MSDDIFDTSGLIDDFVEDAREQLNRLDDALLQFEQSVEAGAANPRLLESVYGPLHTLKGNGGMMGFSYLQEGVHELESALKRLTAGATTVSTATVDALFKVSRLLRSSIESLAIERKEVETLQELPALLKQLVVEGRGTQSTTPSTQDLDSTPATNDSDIAQFGIGTESQNIKIDFKRLDKLLNLVGELVMYRTALSQVHGRILEQLQDADVNRDLSDISQLMGKTVTELQESIMAARLLPVRHVLNPFPRLVRDIARERGKRVTLHLKGAETELDKTVIDKIGEPLLHLVRNAVDHGIEMPEERGKGGKAEVGNITISASQESNHIVLLIEDDGRGIDAQAVLKKARALGIVDEKAKLSDPEIHDLIFAKGFSTAESITQLSGRGVGMDVVREVISSLGGVIEIDTIPRMGTKFTIKLPLTLAIISALLVDVGGETYAIPITHVLESIRLNPSDIHIVNKRRVIQLRDRVLPLLELRAMFGLPPAKDTTPYVVVLGRGERRIGLVVDGLLGQLEIVIKGLDEVVGTTRYIAGASVLGDGRVVLIVDVAQLLSGQDAAVV